MQLNRPAVSASPERQIPRDIAYAISGIIAQCLSTCVETPYPESNLAIKHVVKMAWMTSIAWDAIIAGDIESIREHVQVECKARGTNDLLS